MKAEVNQPKKDEPNPFQIVGIGASAGGIEAMTKFLENLSPTLGMAFVYIQHLDRSYESNLVEILQRSTKMEISTIEDNVHLEPNHIYVIPPNKEISIEGEVLSLSSRQEKPSYSLQINHFFLSLAEAHKERAIGIILSGMASDGALGIKAIKNGGGLTYAQDDSAKYDSMPKSAIAEGGVDAVLSPEDIAKDLDRIAKNLVQFESLLEEEIKVADDESEIIDPKKDDFATILHLLKNAHGVDFTHYKKNTIKRRIIRRLLIHKIVNLDEYVVFLKKNSNEVSSLYNDLLINVTHFFRDTEASEYLKSTLLPGLLKSKKLADPLRIWVAACSTGEEAYSMAILVLESMPADLGFVSVQIFATDLSELAIAKARLGIYSAADVQMVSPERLSRFFTKVDGHFRVNKNLRDICVFAPHNIFKDPPFSRVDIISCCNVLIYLDNVLQKKIMSNFQYALKEKGFLILGQSETVGSSTQYFNLVEKRLKIYAKKPGVSAKALLETKFDYAIRENIQVRTSKVADNDPTSNLNLERLVDKMILSDFSPAGVVINHDMDILQFRGSTSLYLEPAPGRASLNILKMARAGLAFELRNAIIKVIKNGVTLKKEGIELNHKGSAYQISFTVAPLTVSAETRLLMVMFEETKVPVYHADKGRNSKDRRVKQLENELLSLREDMRSVLEAQEAANEELQSANEEILSSNEELQSINEELETSKEEIESSNEELTTINQELFVRNEQLAESNRYTEAVISTIRESVLILDSKMHVKSANKTFYTTFKTSEKDVEGRSIYDLGDGEWRSSRLRELIDELMPKHSFHHGFEIVNTFKNIGEKAFLVNAQKIEKTDNQPELTLLAFEDITEHKQAARLLKEREAWLRNMTDNVPVMIWVATPDKNFTYLNKTWLLFTGRTLSTETGIGWTEGIHRDDLKLCLSAYHDAFDKKVPLRIEYRMKRHDGEYRWVLNMAVPTFNSDNIFTGYIGSATEIHDKRMLNTELEKLVTERTSNLLDVNHSLEISNNELQQFAYIASHDLQEPLRKIHTFSSRLKERFDELSQEERLDNLNKIMLASKRMTNLIDDLLDFSRATNDHQFENVDLGEVLRNVINDFELTISEKSANITYENLPVIKGIPLQINQLFFNLLGNALKFSKPGVSPIIDITSKKLTQNEMVRFDGLDRRSTYWQIKFIDNGIGFSPEFAEQIFIIFQRLNDRQSYAGTGIGLAICRKIAENHGGKIYAESELEKGATFILILPEKAMQ